MKHNLDEFRVKLDLKFQRELFDTYRSEFSNCLIAAKSLGISARVFYKFLYGETHLVPHQLYLQVASGVGFTDPMSKVERVATLGEFLKEAATKGYDRIKQIYGGEAGWAKHRRESMLRMYGENFGKKLAQAGHKKLMEIYGEDWAEDVTKLARKKLQEIHGDDWQKNLSKAGITALRSKFGRNPHKVISPVHLTKLRVYANNHFSFLGEDSFNFVAKIFSELGYKGLDTLYSVIQGSHLGIVYNSKGYFVSKTILFDLICRRKVDELIEKLK